MINIYRATERDDSENVGIGSHKTAIVAARRARSRKVEGQLNGLDALNVDSWAIAKTDCPNRDTTKIGRGGGQMGVTHKKTQRGDKSGKWYLLYKPKSHSNAEYVKQRKSKKIAQTSTDVADTAAPSTTVCNA